MLTYGAIRAFRTIAEHCPRKTTRAVARILSDLQYHLAGQRRVEVRENVAAILAHSGRPKTEEAAITREVFRSFGRYLADFLSLRRYTNDEIRAWVKVNDIAILEDVRAQGRGGVLLTGHFGNWELSAIIISLLGYPVTAVADPHPDKRLNDLFMDMRAMRGVKCVNVGFGVKECFKALARNEYICLAADWVQPGTGVPVQMFGRTVHFPQGPAKLALSADVPVMPGVLSYDEDGRPVLDVDEPVWPSQFGPADVGPSEERVQAMSRQLARWLERTIQKHLSQWCMFKRIWGD